jgi:(p)ppGpp synthase/HD superfamily hydrolase
MNQQDLDEAVALTFTAGFACAAHAGQVRKYTGEAYYNHPKRVSEILHEHGHTDIEMLMAAILHDVVEDTHVTAAVIYELFGAVVGQYVTWLTKTVWPEPVPNRAERKAYERKRLASAPDKVKTIKLADVYDNLPSAVEHDPAFAPVTVAETRLLLDESLVGGCPVLWAKLDTIVREFQQQKA